MSPPTAASPPSPTPSVPRLRVLAVLALLVGLCGLGRVASQEILGAGETRASDALPLYLSGAAVAEGLDPTRAESLARVYDTRGMSVGAATFSTLYPASAGTLLRWVSPLSWDTFTEAWRWILLAALAATGASAGWLAGGDRWRRLAWGGVATAVLAWHPVSAECVRLGQVNMVLGALCAAAIAASVRGRGVVAGVALAFGALIKLVPGALLVPLAAARQVRPVVAAAVVGLVGLAATLPVVGLPRFVEAVLETLRFQAAIDPDWLVGRERAPEWMRVLGFVRHDGLQWLTLGTAALIPLARPSRKVAAAAMALVCAWLGADAAGFHVLYIPLAYPALLWVAVDRPGRGVALAVAFHALAWAPGLAPEPRMVLFGLLAWAACAVSLLQAAAEVPAGALEADGELRQGALALFGVAAGAALVGAMPGEGPVAAPLPEGQTAPEGAGFIHAGDRVPGAVRALGAGLDRPASTLAKPGTIRHLQLYLRRAPALWRELADRYPARADAFRARAKDVPASELRDLSGREVAAFLHEEQEAQRKLIAEGYELGELPGALEQALSSGLTDPALETRIPQAQE